MKPALLPRILHVTNDEEQRKHVRRSLPIEWHVAGAESVHRARKLLANERFDVVVIDPGLPDDSRSELVPHTGTARVIMFSSTQELRTALAELPGTENPDDA